jgi:glycine betaine/proline transport system ATP-binding protein
MGTTEDAGLPTGSRSPRRIEVRNVSKAFGSSANEALSLARQGASRNDILKQTGTVLAVDNVSFSVDAGEIFVVMGLSGSGKSTLARCLNRLHDPTAGSIEIDGEDIVKASEDRLRELRLGKITMVFQHFALLPHRTIAENVEYGLKMRGMTKAARREKALKALENVGFQAGEIAIPPISVVACSSAWVLPGRWRWTPGYR